MATQIPRQTVLHSISTSKCGLRTGVHRDVKMIGMLLFVPNTAPVITSSGSARVVTQLRAVCRVQGTFARLPRVSFGASSGAVMCAETPPPAAPQPPSKPDPTAGPFGIRLRTNGDVLKFGVTAIALGYGMKAVIQAAGVPDLAAGQWTTGILSVVTLLAWISSYVFRVGTKSMTYAQQLKDYEDAVLEKRYNELTEEELQALSEELEEDLRR